MCALWDSTLRNQERKPRLFSLLSVSCPFRWLPKGEWWLIRFFLFYYCDYCDYYFIYLFFDPPISQPYLLSQNSGCELWIHNRPSRSQLPPPAWTKCRICSCLGQRWWCLRLCPRNEATPRSGVRLHPSPPWPAASPRATDSSRRWPGSSTCLYISAGRRNVGQLVTRKMYQIRIFHQKNVDSDRIPCCQE